MNLFTYTLWLILQSIGMLTCLWPVTLALLIAMVVTAVFNFRPVRLDFHPRNWMVLLPLVVALLIPVWGSVMQHTDQTSLAPDWPSVVVYGLFLVQLLVAIAVVHALTDNRWFAAATVLLELWIGAAFVIVANMSVTGDWL